jgi:glycosyltransferase involved in cell wall biosynthesis
LKVRVACVVEAYPPHVGGSETRMSELLMRLPKSWEIHVITPRFDDYPPFELSTNITIHRVGNYVSKRYFLNTDRPINDSVKFGIQASRELKKLGAFDVSVFGEWNLLHYVISERSVDTPRLVDWCEVLAHRLRGLKGLGETLLETYLAKRASHHTAINTKVATDLTLIHRVPKSRVSVVPNGVHREILAHSRPEKDYGRILFVGRITPHKQPELLIQAAKNLPNCVFVFVGWGDPAYTQKLKRIAPRNVYFLGELSREQLVTEYRRAWVFALPSTREGSSISALEAMSNYTPVVTVNAPLNYSVYDAVQDGFNGIVTRNDPKSLAEGLKKMLRDEQLYQELSHNAYETAKRRCWDVLAKRFTEVLEGVAIQKHIQEN